MKPAPSVLPPKPPLRWRTHRLERSLGEHAAAWARLHERLPLQHPMLDVRYVERLLSHYANGDELLCVLADRDDVAAMTILRPRGMGTWTTFLPAQTQVGPHLMSSLDQTGGLASALPGWVQRIEFLSVDPEITADPTPGTGMPECLPQALTAGVEVRSDFDSYWGARSRKLRQRVRALERTAQAEMPPTRWALHRTPSDVQAAVSRYAVLESSGWKGEQGTALAPGNEQERFYTELMTSFAQTGEAVVIELWFGDHLAASRLTIESDRTIATLKTTYDESMKRIAPGRLMLRYLIESCHKHSNGKRIEFCTNATQEQLSWMTHFRWVCHWTVFPTTSAARTQHFLRSILGCWRSRDAHRNLLAKIDIRDPIRIEEYSSCAALPPDAIQLLDQQSSSDIGLGADWFAHLEQSVFCSKTSTYGSESTVGYITMTLEGSTVAVLPWTEKRGHFGSKLSSLTSMYTALFAPALRPWLGPVDLLPLIRRLRQRFSPLKSLTLVPVDLNAPSTRVLNAALALDGFLVFPYFCFGNWTIAPPKKWDEYVASRPGALRSSIHRASRRLAGMGAKTEIFSRPEDAERALMAFQHVYARSWKVPEPFPEFIPGLVDLCARKGWLRMGVVWLGEKPIAAQLWIVANGRAAIFKLAYDEAYRRLGAGTALTAHLMKCAIEHDRVYEVDYLIGDDAYKRDWMNQRKERWGLVAFNPRTLGGAVGALGEATGRAVKPWLRSLPAWRDGVSVRSEKP